MADFLFVPLRPFLCAALAKRWKVQFRTGLHKFNNVDSKTTYFNENCCMESMESTVDNYEERMKHNIYIHIYIATLCDSLISNSPSINKIYVCIYIYIYIYMHTYILFLLREFDIKLSHKVAKMAH